VNPPRSTRTGTLNTYYTLNFNYRYNIVGIVCLEQTQGIDSGLYLKIKVRDLLQIRRKTPSMKKFLKNFVEVVLEENSA
jgi:hypothetical protein